MNWAKNKRSEIKIKFNLILGIHYESSNKACVFEIYVIICIYSVSPSFPRFQVNVKDDANILKVNGDYILGNFQWLIHKKIIHSVLECLASKGKITTQTEI